MYSERWIVVSADVDTTTEFSRSTCPAFCLQSPITRDTFPPTTMTMSCSRQRKRGTAPVSHALTLTMWIAVLSLSAHEALANPHSITAGVSSSRRIHHSPHTTAPVPFNRGVVTRIRGGSTGWVAAPEPISAPVAVDDHYRPPDINLEHMSLALRLTGEFNRRLHHGTRVPTNVPLLHEPDQPTQTSPRISDPLRGGESSTMTVHQQSQAFGLPPVLKIRSVPTDAAQEALTLFHAKAPRKSKPTGPVRRGAERWGPNLLTYLRHVSQLLGLNEEDSSLELAMAMIYLDRACSVETPRSQKGTLPSCPFLAPRTIHRLCLTALIVATQAVRGTPLEQQYVKLESLGIPLQQLQQMVDWMTQALGDLGFFLAPDQMRDWRKMWECRFPSKVADPESANAPSLARQAIMHAGDHQRHAAIGAE